jgi:hypothetical protein
MGKKTVAFLFVDSHQDRIQTQSCSRTFGRKLRFHLAATLRNRIRYFSNHTIRRQLVVSTTNLGRSHETPNTQKQRYALFNIKEDTMNPLDSIPGTIASGFALTVVLYFVVKMLV